ncbi:hypothetical protein HK100_001604 [Physocladia obscura]|uniref:Uncharacterized protein n=1 Tax=Physocladia obscura TaxID=109957 RepID=A0AAD5XES0_9FUNG|nr:hypothetical protein HK100_001604 [Physocladia obscura]
MSHLRSNASLSSIRPTTSNSVAFGSGLGVSLLFTWSIGLSALVTEDETRPAEYRGFYLQGVAAATFVHSIALFSYAGWISARIPQPSLQNLQFDFYNTYGYYVTDARKAIFAIAGVFLVLAFAFLVRGLGLVSYARRMPNEFQRQQQQRKQQQQSKPIENISTDTLLGQLMLKKSHESLVVNI